MKPNTQAKETRLPDREQNGFRSKRSEIELIEERLTNLRSSINELGQQIDSYRARTAAALGGGVFLVLLAAGAGYEILAGKSGVWFSLTAAMLRWIAILFAITGAALFALAFIRERRRDFDREATLDELEEEFAELLERKETISRLANETPPQ